MSKQSRRYTDSQRQSVLRAVLVDGHSVAEAHRRAVAGNLPDTPAFALAYRSAVAIVAQGREGFEAQAVQDPAAARATLDADALLLVGLAHRAAEKVAADANKNGPDPRAIKQAAEAITAARRALPPERPTAKPTEPQPAEQDGPLSSLLALAGTNGNGGTNGHTTTETHA